MKISKEARKISRQLFRASFADGMLVLLRMRSLVETIIAEKPRFYIDILKNYQRLIRLEVEKRHAIVESAAPLNDDTSRKIMRDLQTKYGGDLTADFKVNTDLLGGLRIKIGSDVWDGTVRNRLDRLEAEIA